MLREKGKVHIIIRNWTEKVAFTTKNGPFPLGGSSHLVSGLLLTIFITFYNPFMNGITHWMETWQPRLLTYDYVVGWCSKQERHTPCPRIFSRKRSRRSSFQLRFTCTQKSWMLQQTSSVSAGISLGIWDLTSPRSCNQTGIWANYGCLPTISPLRSRVVKPCESTWKPPGIPNLWEASKIMDSLLSKLRKMWTIPENFSGWRKGSTKLVCSSEFAMDLISEWIRIIIIITIIIIIIPKCSV